jgi:hypothetical protein
VSWLCNEGVFRGQIKGAARERAIEAVRRMGYELHISSAEISRAASDGVLTMALTLTNTGVAPFYYNWPVELAAMDGRKQIAATWKPDWKLTAVIPGEAAPVWRFTAETKSLSPGTYQLLLRVPNPLLNGPPLRFANEAQDRPEPGWLTLGHFNR